MEINWSERYKAEEKPTSKQIEKYVNSPFLKELCDFIEENYDAKPSTEYSTCSLRPGWNVKYKKSSKSVCTIYPAEDYFTCMVSYGSKKALDIECLIPSCTGYIQNLYNDTDMFNGGKWLMIDVTGSEILRDVKTLISSKMSK